MRRQSNGRVSLTVRRILQTRLNIFFREIGKIFDDLLPGHSGRDPTKHVTDRDSQTTNAGFATSFARLDGYNLFVVHMA